MCLEKINPILLDKDAALNTMRELNKNLDSEEDEERMKEMQESGGGGMFGSGNMPEMFNLVINTNSDLISQIIKTKTKKKQERLISQSIDLAKLSHGLLSGEELTNFIKRSFDIIK